MKIAPLTGVRLSYRGNQIRTDDILLPKQTLYQAELHPEWHKYNKKNADKQQILKKEKPILINQNRFPELRRARTFDPRLKRALLYQLS